MKVIVTIQDLPNGRVLIEVQGEHTRPCRATRVFDLIMPALRRYFQPVSIQVDTPADGVMRELRAE